jgi:hypothetical protein
MLVKVYCRLVDFMSLYRLDNTCSGGHARFELMPWHEDIHQYYCGDYNKSEINITAEAPRLVGICAINSDDSRQFVVSGSWLSLSKRRRGS